MPDRDSLTRKEQLQIEGYKSLTQYGCQMSQDHISTDRVMIPLSLAPAIWVLRPLNGQFEDNWAKTLILLGGVSLIVFWIYRNRRSEKRLNAIWDILRLIEAPLGFEAHLMLKRFMETMELDNGRWRERQSHDRKPPPRDFTLKKYFGWFALGFYGLVLIYVWWANIVSWICC